LERVQKEADYRLKQADNDLSLTQWRILAFRRSRCAGGRTRLRPGYGAAEDLSQPQRHCGLWS